MHGTTVNLAQASAFALLLLLGLGLIPEQARAGAPEEFAARFEELKKVFVLARTAAREIPADTFDPNAVLSETSENYKRINDWVAENTAWVPYRGVLRGSTGVLMDRVGSHLDRAVLLADLLERAGHEVRIERGTLTAEQAEQYWSARAEEQQKPEKKPSRAAEEQALSAQLDEVARILGAPIETVRSTYLMALQRGEQLVEKLTGDAALLTPRLATAFGFADEPGGPAFDPELFADHYRVAIKRGKQWILLDPLAGRGKAGTSLFGEPSETFALKDLPEEWYHRLVVRVEAERLADGALSRGVALLHRMNAADLVGDAPSLTLRPLDWPRDLPEITLDADQIKDLGERTRAAYLAQKEWLPTLDLDQGEIRQKSILADGSLVDAPAITIESRKVSGAQKGLASALGGRKTDGELTGVFVVLEVRAPGQEPIVTERAWLDLLGPARRDAGGTDFVPTDAEKNARAVGLGGVMNLLALPCRPSDPWLAKQSLSTLLENRVPVLGALYAAMRDEGDQVAKYLGRSRPSPVELFSLMRTRYLPVNPETRFVDGLNVVASFSHPRLAGEKLELIQGLDLVRVTTGVRPGARESARAARFAGGVSDTVAEALTLPRTLGKRRSAAESYARAIAGGEEWVLLNDPSQVASADIALGDDARARVRAALAAGKRILAPPEGSPGGAAVWWEFDPVRGTVLGRTEGGHGGATEEIVLIANDAFSLIMTMKGVLACRGLSDLEMACCLLQNAVFGGYGLAVGGNFAKAGLDLWGVAFNVAYSTATAQINLCGG